MNRNNSSIEDSLRLIKEEYGDESNIDDLLDGVKLGIANITDPGALRRGRAIYPPMHDIGQKIAHIVARETIKKYNPLCELKTGRIEIQSGGKTLKRNKRSSKSRKSKSKRQ
jgi:hypothetical protein